MFPTLSATATMNKTQYGKGKSRATPEGIWEYLYDQGLIDIYGTYPFYITTK